MAPIREFATNLGQAMIKVTISEFFRIVHNRFYADGDMHFMLLFLELLDHEDEFFIHHTKLTQYGISSVTSATSARKRMIAIGLTEGIDFQMSTTHENVSIPGVLYGYKLTPAAFRTCLFKAKRNAKSIVDPTIYARHFLHLEKTYRMFIVYERAYRQAVVERDVEHIQSLILTIADLENEISSPVDVSCLDDQNIAYASMDWY
jgi:hypothetical protein